MSTPKRLWLDLGEFGNLTGPFYNADSWQDHGQALLRTILHKNNLMTDLASLRTMRSWVDVPPVMRGYDMLLMNVRSYTFPFAKQAAKIFKQLNPSGVVIAGGMHATVAPHEMEAISAFDYICKGGGEEIICDLVRDPKSFSRIVNGINSASLNDWPDIDRTLWPNPGNPEYCWPLEPSTGWGPSPIATVITSRVCPW